jgi:hypothetical protein
MTETDFGGLYRALAIPEIQEIVKRFGETA